MTITRDDDILGGEPRVDGTRIGVRHISARVVDGGRSPAHIADQFDLSLSAVYEALSYYYDNVAEMRELEQANESAFDRARDSSLTPKERIE
jgi:uncharacterized protein (DUF433 family)